MSLKTIIAIKEWIRFMGFELINTQKNISKNTGVNYYNLGNFGIYEEFSNFERTNSIPDKVLKYISWNPWGDKFEVNSVKDLSKAYEDSLLLNP